MYRESMEGQTLLFKSKTYSKAYSLEYFNNNYASLNEVIADSTEVYYKCNNSRNSWINYNKAIVSNLNMSVTERINFELNNNPIDINVMDENGKPIIILPETEYIDSKGYMYKIGENDGFETLPSTVLPMNFLNPSNFSFSLFTECINEKLLYRLKVDFKAVIDNALILFNGLFEPYRKDYDKMNTSVTYYQEDDVSFFNEINDEFISKIKSGKDYLKNHCMIMPYIWEGIYIESIEKPTKIFNENWLYFEKPINNGCLLFYNKVMYYYEINKQDEHYIKIIDEDLGNVNNFDNSKIEIIRYRFENDDEEKGLLLKQQKLEGLFQISKDDTNVYFSSAINNAIITYNGINHTYLINPDRKSIKFVIPHEIYNWDYDLFKTIYEGSRIFAINFYIGEIDEIFKFPHDKMTTLANTVINKYKEEADELRRKLTELQVKTKLIYPGYEEKLYVRQNNQCKFKLKYIPDEDSIELFINGVKYARNTYFMYENNSSKGPYIIWTYNSKSSGFDLNKDYEVIVKYNINYDKNQLTESDIK